MAEPQTTPQRNTSALDSALNTQMQSMPGEVRGAMKLRQEAAKLEADVERDVARKTRETLDPIQQRLGQEIGTTQKQVGEIGAQLAKPFEIPKETVGDMAQLGALVSMIGVMLGSSGKQSAQNVIGAMNGTLTGYKKGRADMIAQAQKEFEVNMKRLQSLSQNAQTKLELASKLAATDTEKAKLLLAEFKAEHAGSIAAAKVASNDAFNALSAANQIRQLNQSASQHADRMLSEAMKHIYIDPATGKKLYIDPKTRQLTELSGSEGLVSEREYLQAQKDAAADRRRELDRQLKVEMAAQKAEGAGALPKDEKTRSAHASRYQVAKQAEDILSLLNDPKYSKLINPSTKFTPDVIANLQKNFPELATKLARIQKIEFEIGGKNLTGSEQKILEPVYGWRGINAETLRTRLRSTIEEMNTSNSLVEEYFPGLKAVRDKYDRVYEERGVVPPVQAMPGGSSSAGTAPPSAASAEDMQQRAIAAFGSYEPDKYEYGINPSTNRFARRLK